MSASQVYSVTIRKTGEGETVWTTTCEQCGVSFDNGTPVTVLVMNPPVGGAYFESFVKKFREQWSEAAANRRPILINHDLEKLEFTNTLEQAMLAHAERCERSRR